MQWVKRGLVYAPSGGSSWAKSHAIAPTPYLSDNALRMYVGMCDEDMVSRIGWVDLDPADPGRVLAESSDPVLDIGERGAFDDNGVVPTGLVSTADGLHLYYAGFQRAPGTGYSIFTGLAVSTDGGQSFTRRGRTPVLDRTDREPLWRTAAYVMVEDGAWKAWYSGGAEWTSVDGKDMPVLALRYAESEDGVAWPADTRTCLAPSGDGFAFSRPYVVRIPSGYAMFYSIRGRTVPYVLGYAESADGVSWERKDEELGLGPSPEGWDSEMLYAPSIVRSAERTFLFYNGNGTGATGFGYAELAAA